MEIDVGKIDINIETLLVDLEDFLQSEQPAPANKILKLIELRKALRAYMDDER